MSVIVTEDNYIEGYDIIQVGNNFDHVFNKLNIAPHGSINRFLANVTDLQGRLAQEAYEQAINEVKILASRNGWNAVLNFDIEFEEVGEWASINSVNVHVYGTVCNVIPSNENSFDNNEYDDEEDYSRMITCCECGQTFNCTGDGNYVICPYCNAELIIEG